MERNWNTKSKETEKPILNDFFGFSRDRHQPPPSSFCSLTETEPESPNPVLRPRLVLAQLRQLPTRLRDWQPQRPTRESELLRKPVSEPALVPFQPRVRALRRSRWPRPGGRRDLQNSSSWLRNIFSVFCFNLKSVVGKKVKRKEILFIRNGQRLYPTDTTVMLRTKHHKSI
jgi:hypothetical protein